MASWEVIDFQIHADTSEPKLANFETGGEMRVLVYVFIKAHIKGTGDKYSLTEDERQTVELVDLDANDSLLEGWSYSDADLSDIPPEIIVRSLKDKGHLKCYWVSSTKPEDRKIAAHIRQPDGQLVTTQMGAEIPFANLADTTTTTLQVVPDMTCSPGIVKMVN